MNLKTFSLKVADPKGAEEVVIDSSFFGRALFFLLFGRRLLIGSSISM